ncbi:MAG TPA: M17 family peptidase N-terminal domain-containing protein, partial [Acidisarcina sp.]
MKIVQSHEKISMLATELLAVFAVDTASSKAPAKPGEEPKPQISLLTTDKAVLAATTTVLEGGEFKGGMNEVLLLHAPDGLAAKRLLIIGLGKAAKVAVHDYRKAAGTVVRFTKPRGIRDMAIAAPAVDKRAGWVALPPGPCIQAITEGALLADFDSDTYRSDRKDQSIQSLTIVSAKADRAAADTAVLEGTILAEAQNFARSLVNEPGNVLTPTVLGERAAAMAAEVGLKSEVYSTEKLQELKMGAFLAVAQGSEQPPALIVLTYTPENAPANGPVLGL